MPKDTIEGTHGATQVGLHLSETHLHSNFRPYVIPMHTTSKIYEIPCIANKTLPFVVTPHGPTPLPVTTPQFRSIATPEFRTTSQTPQTLQTPAIPIQTPCTPQIPPSGSGSTPQLQITQSIPPHIASHTRTRRRRYHTSHIQPINRTKPSEDPLLKNITQKLSCPIMRKQYFSKDIVWVLCEDNEWRICIIKYVNSGNELIVRPFGSAECDEIKIQHKQIHQTPNTLSLDLVRQCIKSVKFELSHIYNNKQEIYQSSLVKFKENPDIFGQVVQKHENGTFTVKIKDECMWYRGTKYLAPITRKQIDIASETQFQETILKKKYRNKREKEVYDFLGEFGDFYIDELLSNGFTNMELVLLLTESDLKELNVRMAHRWWILKKLERERHKRNHDLTDHHKFIASRVRVVIFDFDRTITVDRLYNPLLCSGMTQQAILDGMTDDAVLKAFGGQQRVDRLSEHFKILKAHNIDLAIIAFCFVLLMKTALKKVNLYQHFTDSKIIGSDSGEWRDGHGSKPKCIINVFLDPNSLSQEDIVLVDDDPCDIREAQDAQLCKTVLIENRQGMQKHHMQRLEVMLGCHRCTPIDK